MEYICDFLGSDYILFDSVKKEFRLQKHDKYDSDFIQNSIRERKKYALKVALSNRDTLNKLINQSGYDYGNRIFCVKAAFSMDSLVILDGRYEDCVTLSFCLDYLGNFKSDCLHYNLSVDAYFYHYYTDDALNSEAYDFHLSFMHRCPLELIWRLLEVQNNNKDEYLSIYLGFLGGNVSGVIENILNFGVFSDRDIVDTTGSCINQDKLLEYFSMNSRLVFNPNGVVYSPILV